MLGTDAVPSPDEGTSDDAADWAIPADRPGARDPDPWWTLIDDVGEDAEHRFQYPAGLP